MLMSYIQGMKKYSTILLIKVRILHYTYDRGSCEVTFLLNIIVNINRYLISFL